MVNPRVLEYLFPNAAPERHYRLEDSGSGPDIVYWDADSLGAQPTAQEIATAEASPEFIAWHAEHGGDASLTLRRQAKEALDRQASEQEALLRATILVLIDELNALRGWITDYKAAVAAAGSLAALKTATGNLPNMPDRTADQARTAIKGKLTAGDADE